MRLKGRAAIITGAGRGLGRASALMMAREGASVVVISRTGEEIEETGKLLGKNSVALVADVSRPRDVKHVVRKALSAFGRIDILMNNASILGPVGPTCEVSRSEWEEVFRINVGGVLAFSSAVLPYMKIQGGGKIINVTSGLGEIVMPPLGPYSVTKAAVIHLTRIMAEELRPHNIQVNGLDPGVMDTKMQEAVRDMGPEVLGRGVYERFSGLNKGGYLRPPVQSAGLSVFLSSEASDHITGENGTENHYMQMGYRPPQVD